MKWLMVCCQELSCHDFNKARGTNGSAFEVCFSLLKPSIFDRQCCNSRVLPSKSLSLWREVLEEKEASQPESGQIFWKRIEHVMKITKFIKIFELKKNLSWLRHDIYRKPRMGLGFLSLCDLCDSSLSKSSAWWSPWIRSRRSSWAYTTSCITDFTICFFHVCVSQISTMSQHKIKSNVWIYLKLSQHILKVDASLKIWMTASSLTCHADVDVHKHSVTLLTFATPPHSPDLFVPKLEHAA